LGANPQNKKDYKDCKYEASFLAQYKWLIWRNYVNDKRQPLTKILIAQVLFMALFFGLTYLQIKNDQVGVGNRNGLLFCLVLIGSFLDPILNNFCGELPIFYREKKNKLYSTFIYYTSKQVVHFPKFFLLNTIFFIIMWWMSGLNPSGQVFFEAFLLFQLHIQCCMSFGYFVSTLSGNIELVSSISSSIVIPLTLFSGFFLNTFTVPKYFIWIKYISWYFYMYDCMMIVQWRDYGSIPCSENVANITTPTTSFPTTLTRNITTAFPTTLMSNMTTKLPEDCFSSRCYKTGKDVLEQFSIDEVKF
jgi:ABC-type multidrug transport system permease subunit